MRPNSIRKRQPQKTTRVPKENKEVKEENKSNNKLYLLLLTSIVSIIVIYVFKAFSIIGTPNAVEPETIKVVERSEQDSEAKVIEQVEESRQEVKHNEEVQLPSRIVAIGDLHGDFYNSIKTLKMASLIDSENNWIGNTTTLVQTGDIVDRGPDTILLYRLFQRLTIQASEVGGKVIVLLGNHEILNLGYDWRYVPPEDLQSFGGVEERIEAWSLNGWIGKYLNTLTMSANVNGTVFFHAGANLDFSKLGIKGINEKTSNTLKNTHPLQYKFQSIFGDESPVWYRGYALKPENVVCQELRDVLKNFDARRMVIGHTPQMNGIVLSRCEHLVYVIDVGISRVYGGHSAALEIIGDQVSAIYPTKTVKLT